VADDNVSAVFGNLTGKGPRFEGLFLHLNAVPNGQFGMVSDTDPVIRV